MLAVLVSIAAERVNEKEKHRCPCSLRNGTTKSNGWCKNLWTDSDYCWWTILCTRCPTGDDHRGFSFVQRQWPNQNWNGKILQPSRRFSHASRLSQNLPSAMSLPAAICFGDPVAAKITPRTLKTIPIERSISLHWWNTEAEIVVVVAMWVEQSHLLGSFLPIRNEVTIQTNNRINGANTIRHPIVLVHTNDDTIETAVVALAQVFSHLYSRRRFDLHRHHHHIRSADTLLVHVFLIGIVY